MDIPKVTQVSAFEAKTHLSQLLVQVQQGQRVTITKHNVPVALLVPVEESKQLTQEMIDDIFERRKKHTLGELSIQQLKEEGRR